MVVSDLLGWNGDLFLFLFLIELHWRRMENAIIGKIRMVISGKVRWPNKECASSYLFCRQLAPPMTATWCSYHPLAMSARESESGR